MGTAVWAALFGLLLAYQGFALVRDDDRWPAFSDVMRSVTRYPVGRR